MTRDPYPGERPKDWVAPGKVAPPPASSTGKKVGIGCAIVAGIFIVLAVLGAALGDQDKGKATATGASSDAVSNSSPEGSNHPAEEATTLAESPAEPENDPEMSAAEFAQLRQGMSYDEAVSVIGSPGELSSETEMAGTRTQMYSWEGEGSFGANANAMFQNGKLVSKAQFGLK